MANTFPVSKVIIESQQWKELPPSAKVLHEVLCKLKHDYRGNNKHGWFYRSVRLLEQDTGLNKDTIIKARSILIDNKFIQVQIVSDYKRRKATKYKVLSCQFFGHKLK